MEISLNTFIGSLRTLTNTYASSYHQVVRKVFFPPYLIGAYSIIINKDELNKENSRIKIRMGIKLPNVQGASEKLRRMFRSHKIRSTFYFESFFVNYFVN